MKPQHSISVHIKDARTSSRLTQKQLAKKLGLTDKTISAYETGRAVPTALTLVKISEITNIPVSKILNFSKKTETKTKKQSVSLLIDRFSKFSVLKKVERAGWVLKGIRDVETIADHNYRVGIMAMLIFDMLPKLSLNLDRVKIYELSFVHDWGVTSVGDVITEHGLRIIAEKRKGKVEEREAVREISGNFGLRGERYLELWDEYYEQKTPESKFLKQVEKLEMALQALEYETQGYSPNLFDEFWENAEKYLKGKELEPIFRELVRMRRENG